MSASSSIPRKRAASVTGAPPRVSFRRSHGEFTQEFDHRPMRHTKGTRLRLARPPALRRGRSAPASSRHMADPAEDIDQSWIRAADNASEVEWARARAELKILARRSMCASEAGVRLYNLFRRVPSLLSGELGEMLNADVAGGRGEQATPRELLPLPLPRMQLLREPEVTSLFILRRC